MRQVTPPPAHNQPIRNLCFPEHLMCVLIVALKTVELNIRIDIDVLLISD